MEFTLAGLVRRLVHFKMDVVYPDQTFGSGYHSYGALAVTGTAPWNHSTPGKPVVDKVRNMPSWPRSWANLSLF